MDINGRRDSGKLALEAALFILLFVAALAAMTVYMKRAGQGRMRSSSDDIGEAYAPGYTTSQRPVSATSRIVDATRGGVATQTVQESTVTAGAWERIPGYGEEMWWDSLGVAHAEPGPVPYAAQVPGSASPRRPPGQPYEEGGLPEGGWGQRPVRYGSGGSGGRSTPRSGSLPVQSQQPSQGYTFPRPLPATGPSLTNVLQILASSSSGGALFDLIRQHDISVFYYDFSMIPGLDDGVLAFWYNDENAIVVNQQAAAAMSEQAIAAVVGHEAVHADYDYYPQRHIEDTLSRHPELTLADLHIAPDENSIDQEFQAFGRAALIWDEVAGGRSDPELDFVSAAYAQGEEYLKALIRVYYPDLPEF